VNTEFTREKTVQRNICKICNEDYYNPDALKLHYALDHDSQDDGGNSDDNAYSDEKDTF